MRYGRNGRLGVGVAAAIAAATAIVVPASLGRAAEAAPSLRLLTGIHHIEADRFGSSWDLFIPQSAYVTSTHGSFEIDARHKNGRVSLEQVRRAGSGVTKIRHLKTLGPVKIGLGLPRFFSLVLKDASGAVVASAHPAFCPTVGYDAQRVSPTSADNPSYPETCGDNLTRATVWGIDAGWAEPLYFDLKASPEAAPDGTYTLTIGITSFYAHELKVAAADRATSVSVKIVTQSDGCTALCPEPARAHRRIAVSARAPARRHQVTARPGPTYPGGLPDLVALPAHGLKISHDDKNGRDYLGFGATIWNAGPGTFDVEGFRVGARPTMRARQYVYRDGRSVRSMPIGHFEFDNRRGHHHWHLEDVARYDLLDAKGNRVVLSDKQSFCLAPTDPVNLTVPDAVWNPYPVGLSSSCPTDQSLWLRETLPVGWGDTYVQDKGGQSFNITDLPDGSYLIRIATNPFGHIHETTRANDTALLSIELGGVPGARTVTNQGRVQ